MLNMHNYCTFPLYCSQKTISFWNISPVIKSSKTRGTKQEAFTVAMHGNVNLALNLFDGWESHH